MVATRTLLIVVLLTFTASALFSQEQLRSFRFSERPIAEALKEVVESHGYYLSFRPGIFDGSPPVTSKVDKSTLPNALKMLLKEKFQYKIIDKYVVVTPSVTPSVTRSENRSELKPAKASDAAPVLVYDTIPIQQIEIVYDTQTVIQKEIFYDTVTIKKLLLSLDTVQVSFPEYDAEDRWSAGGFFGFLQRRRVGGIAEANYGGIELGASVQHRYKNYNFQLDLSYQYLIDQVSTSNAEEVIETRVDTISTFFIIRDGIREPVYITETTEVTSEIKTVIERTNSLQFLGASFTGGYQHPMGNISMGIRVGLRAEWLISREEWLFLDGRRIDDRSIQYSAPVTSVVAHFPIALQKDGLIGTISFTPFFQYGLNRDLLTPDFGGNRYVFGIRVGILL